MAPLCNLISWVLYLTALWFLFPLESRMDQQYRERMKFYIMYCGWFVLQTFQFLGLGVVYKNIPLSLQWLIALIIPGLRAANGWILTQFVTRMSGHNNEMANVVVTTSVSNSYALYITIQLISATNVTVYCILGVEFCIHLFSCYQIIRLHRKVGGNVLQHGSENANRKEKMMGLIINEMIELLVPLVYGIGFATAYYGPNAHLIAGVKSSYYGSKPVEDLQHWYSTLAQFLSMDLCAMICGGVILWLLTRVNLAREISLLLNKYWFIFMMKLGIAASNWSPNDMNCGTDNSLKFLWITDEGRLGVIFNSTDLSDDEKSFLLQNTAFG